MEAKKEIDSLKEILIRKRALEPYELDELMDALEWADIRFIEFILECRGSKLIELKQLTDGSLSNKQVRCICSVCRNDTGFKQIRRIIKSTQVLCRKCWKNRYQKLPVIKERIKKYTEEYYKKSEVISRRRAYNKEYYRQPEAKKKGKEYAKKYKQRPEVKEKARKYMAEKRSTKKKITE